MPMIYRLDDEPAVGFAASELAQYLKKLTGQVVSIRHVKNYVSDKNGIWLGIIDDFGERKPADLSSSRWDDGYSVQHDGKQLRILGTNGRSVLFGVYAYLEHLGVRWVRPGKNGEIVPPLSHLPTNAFEITESASYRHRGVCIEGSPSLKHALDMIDWMAKHRMNSFFLQFRHSGTFWERWYSHDYNPTYGAPQHLSEADYYANDQAVIAEIKKRGMLLHQVGHGWTATTIGLPGNSWQSTEIPIAPEKKRWLAKVNGRRALFHDIPINTELCYSYRPAFKALIANISAYATVHREIDVLHFWLSDAMNNKCECTKCATMSPADWYVKLVNALSDALFKIDPDRRFVFLSYFESWWAPETLVVDSSRGNAILMFAPISRCFRHALTDSACSSSEPLKRPVLNTASMPQSNQTFVSLLDTWGKAYSGDSFLFDYYLWSGIHMQASDVELARIIHKDMQALHGLGLNGLISCQVLRSFWPTGLPMIAMAETTWNRHLQWKLLKYRYLEAAFGQDYVWVDQYLRKLEKMILGSAKHDSSLLLQLQQPKRLRALEQYLMANHVDLYARADRVESPVQKESYRILVHHNQFLLMQCQTALGKGRTEDVMAWLLASENVMHAYLDIPALITMQFKH